MQVNIILLENFGSWHFIFGSIRENRPQRVLIFLKTPHNIGEGSPRYNFCTKTGYSLSYQLSLPATFHTNERELPARANPRPPSSEPVISPNAIEYVLNFHLIWEQWSTNWSCTQSQYRPRDLINTLSQWEQVSESRDCWSCDKVRLVRLVTQTDRVLGKHTGSVYRARLSFSWHLSLDCVVTWLVARARLCVKVAASPIVRIGDYNSCTIIENSCIRDNS